MAVRRKAKHKRMRAIDICIVPRVETPRTREIGLKCVPGAGGARHRVESPESSIGIETAQRHTLPASSRSGVDRYRFSRTYLTSSMSFRLIRN